MKINGIKDPAHVLCVGKFEEEDYIRYSVKMKVGIEYLKDILDIYEKLGFDCLEVLTIDENHPYFFRPDVIDHPGEDEKTGIMLAPRIH